MCLSLSLYIYIYTHIPIPKEDEANLAGVKLPAFSAAPPLLK